MRQLLPPVFAGLLAALLLMAAGFFLAVPHGYFAWLNHLAFGLGESQFWALRHAGVIRPGEWAHHSFVLYFSLISWWVVFAVAGCFLYRRRA
jgi:hypothetical protein